MTPLTQTVSTPASLSVNTAVCISSVCAAAAVNHRLRMEHVGSTSWFVSDHYSTLKVMDSIMKKKKTHTHVCHGVMKDTEVFLNFRQRQFFTVGALQRGN